MLVKQLFNSFQSSEALRWPYSPPEVHLWEHRSYSKNLPSRDSFSTAVPLLVRNNFKSKRGHLNGLFSFLKSGLEALGVGQSSDWHDRRPESSLSLNTPADVGPCPGAEKCISQPGRALSLASSILQVTGCHAVLASPNFR